jgi:hypothetical protein
MGICGEGGFAKHCTASLQNRLRVVLVLVTNWHRHLIFPWLAQGFLLN